MLRKYNIKKFNNSRKWILALATQGKKNKSPNIFKVNWTINWYEFFAGFLKWESVTFNITKNLLLKILLGKNYHQAKRSKSHLVCTLCHNCEDIKNAHSLVPVRSICKNWSYWWHTKGQITLKYQASDPSSQFYFQLWQLFPIYNS